MNYSFRLFNTIFDWLKTLQLDIVNEEIYEITLIQNNVYKSAVHMSANRQNELIFIPRTRKYQVTKTPVH